MASEVRRACCQPENGGRRKLNEAERLACEIRLRAERKAGALSRDLEKAKPGPKPELPSAVESNSKTSHLRNAGISPRQAHQYEKLAAVPEEVFEREVANADVLGFATSQTAQKLMQASRKYRAGAAFDAAAAVAASRQRPPVENSRCPSGSFEGSAVANADVLGFETDRTAQRLMKFANASPATQLTEAAAVAASRQLWGHSVKPFREDDEWYTPASYIEAARRSG
jgi:hypothetical protein